VAHALVCAASPLLATLGCDSLSALEVGVETSLDPARTGARATFRRLALAVKRNEADELAALCAQARAELTKAGQAMHDDVGPLLTSAGFRLQLARMDVPEAATAINEALQILDQAMDQVRALSQKLNPSPAHRGGLKHALLQLAELDGTVTVVYSATAKVPVEIAAALYEAASAAVA